MKPWYRSKTFHGLIAAAIAVVLDSTIGVTLEDGQLSDFAGSLATLVEIAGIVYAGYGRVRAVEGIGR